MDRMRDHLQGQMKKETNARIGSSSGSVAMLAAMRRAGFIASELGPRQRLPAHGEKMLAYKVQ